MKNYKVIPGSGYPYTKIRTDIPHQMVGAPSPAQRGAVLLNVQHTNGIREKLSFELNEVEEVK